MIKVKVNVSEVNQSLICFQQFVINFICVPLCQAAVTREQWRDHLVIVSIERPDPKALEAKYTILSFVCNFFIKSPHTAKQKNTNPCQSTKRIVSNTHGGMPRVIRSNTCLLYTSFNSFITFYHLTFLKFSKLFY